MKHLSLIALIKLFFIFSACNQGTDPTGKSCAQSVNSPQATTNTALRLGTSRPLHDRSNVLVASPRQLKEGGVIPGSYLVAFRGDLGSTQVNFSSFRSEYQYFYPDLARRFLSDQRVKDLDYITTFNLANPSDEFKGQTNAPHALMPFAPSLHHQKTLADIAQLPWDAQDLPEMPALLAKVDFHSPEAARQALEEWELSGDLWYAEPNELSELLQVNNDVVQAYTKAADLAEFGWHRTIKLPQALTILAKAKTLYEPVIAVLDSGVDYTHPLLKDRIWVNPLPGAAGCGNDVNGCDLTARVAKGDLGTGNPHPYTTSGPGQSCTAEEGTCGHGTHVSGIIAANLNNTAGGVCPICKVMPLKIIAKNEKGKGTASDDAIIKALKYIVAFGSDERKLIRVVNSSFGKYNKSRSVGLLVNILKNSPYQTLVVGAAGNDDSMARSYPAAFSEAVAVASIAAEGAGDAVSPLGKAAYSNFGPWVDISAPGGTRESRDIISTFPGGNTQASQGTSMAAPVVAGVAGLVVGLFNDIGFNELRNRIVGFADPRIYSANVNSGVNFSCYNPKFGSDTTRRKLLGTGVLDAEKAVSASGDYIQDSGYNNRVGPGCGTVGRHSFSLTQLTMLFCLILPVLVALTQQRIGHQRLSDASKQKTSSKRGI